MSIEEVKNRFPNFWKAADTFSYERNEGEYGVEYIIAAWTDPKRFAAMYDEKQAFTANDLQEFEQKYLAGVSDEEMDELDKAASESDDDMFDGSDDEY